MIIVKKVNTFLLTLQNDVCNHFREERIQDFAIQFPYDTPKKSKKNENTMMSTGKQKHLRIDDTVSIILILIVIRTIELTLGG